MIINSAYLLMKFNLNLERLLNSCYGDNPMRANQRLDRLFKNGITRKYTECPVCKRSQRRLVERKRPRDDFYMRRLAGILDVAYEDLVRIMEAYCCGRCETIYCDPWLSAEGMSLLYNKGQSRHLLGWENFFKWTQETELDSSIRAKKKFGRW